MSEDAVIEKPDDSRRRRLLKFACEGLTASVLAGAVGAARSTDRGSDGPAGRTPNESQGSITNTIRSANNQVDFTSSSGGWAIRNVGFRGYRSSGHPAVGAAVTDPGGSAVIEGCYFGDGGAGPAIWVHPNHAGELVVRNSYFEGWNDNAVYASGPGNPSGHSLPGRGGVVRVENCYSKGNAVSNFRLGTDGSYLRNCVSVSSQRGYWGFYNTTRVIGCDIGGGIHASDSHWRDPAVVNVENSRFSETFRHYDGATINGTSQGPPRDYYPGVPLSASDAKNGNLRG